MPSKAVAVRNKKTFQDYLEKPEVLEAIKRVAAKGVDAKQVLDLMLLSGSRQPKIRQCNPDSVFQCCSRSAELNLPISDTRGLAYVIPFKNGKTGELELQFIPGYKGLAELARRSGTVKDIDPQIVWEKDGFSLELGSDPRVHHAPLLTGDRGKVIGAYSVAHMTSGVKKIEWMNVEQLEAIRQRSKAKNSGPWVTDRHQMYRKTVLKRQCNYVSLSPQLAKAIAYDNEVAGAIDIDVDVKPGSGLEDTNGKSTPFGFNKPVEPEPAPESESLEPPDPPLTEEQQAMVMQTAGQACFDSPDEAMTVIEKVTGTPHVHLVPQSKFYALLEELKKGPQTEVAEPVAPEPAEEEAEGSPDPGSPVPDPPERINAYYASKLSKARKAASMPDDEWRLMLMDVAGVEIVTQVGKGQLNALFDAVGEWTPEKSGQRSLLE